jgi:hypothetical protein
MLNLKFYKMKRILLACALAVPIGRLLDMVTLIAYNGEVPTALVVLGVITGAGLLWIGYIAAGKILNSDNVTTKRKTEVLNIPDVSQQRGLLVAFTNWKNEQLLEGAEFESQEDAIEIYLATNKSH